MSANPHLSIIIPARNEENRLPRTLEQVAAFLDGQDFGGEILVVENASADRTGEIARDFAAGDGRVRVLSVGEPGKGGAVRAGMLAAGGAYRFMADADLSMPIDQIQRFLEPAADGFDIVIGSREASGAVRYGEPQYRHLGGRLVNTMIRLLALPDLHDTQCGFKLFRAGAAEILFRRQTLAGWSFDIEILYAARLRGCRILELGIPWHYRAESKVNPLPDAIRMFFDILRIRRNARRGVYG
ncbi:MAG TPA: dolichyl-phosphate beta-glucosyltransferase [Anaerolineales bacterium]|nr:dolichyl-phosphate beta-glucosyltransferase [Anaerolineales bacterium]